MTMIDAANDQALELGLLLSQQQEAFGINMIDAMQPADQFEINSLRFAGYSEIEAKQMIFENRYVKNTENEKYVTISEYQLAHRNSAMNSMVVSPCTSQYSKTPTSITKKVSFSEELEQVKVFLSFSSRDEVTELDLDEVHAVIIESIEPITPVYAVVDAEVEEKQAVKATSPKRHRRNLFSIMSVFKSPALLPEVDV